MHLSCKYTNKCEDAHVFLLTKVDPLSIVTRSLAFCICLVICIIPRSVGGRLVSWMRRTGLPIKPSAAWCRVIARTDDLENEMLSIARYLRTQGDSNASSSNRVLFATLSMSKCASADIDVTFFFENTILDPRVKVKLMTVVWMVMSTLRYRMKWIYCVTTFPSLLLKSMCNTTYTLTIITSDLHTHVLNTTDDGDMLMWNNNLQALLRETM